MTTLHDLSTRSAHTGALTRTKKLFVLIACEESQAECIAFRQLGHIAYSCDLQPCRPNGHPDWVKNLPPLMANCDYPNPKEFVRSSRGKYRSRTFPELADAIARQWSAYILDDFAKKTCPIDL